MQSQCLKYKDSGNSNNINKMEVNMDNQQELKVISFGSEQWGQEQGTAIALFCFIKTSENYLAL